MTTPTVKTQDSFTTRILHATPYRRSHLSPFPNPSYVLHFYNVVVEIIIRGEVLHHCRHYKMFPMWKGVNFPMWKVQSPWTLKSGWAGLTRWGSGKNAQIVFNLSFYFHFSLDINPFRTTPLLSPLGIFL